jgi:hypothetical protein
MNRWHRHSQRKAWIILFFLGAIAAILLAVLLPLRNGGSTDANKRWVSMNVEFLTLLVRCVRGAQLVFFVMTFSIVESGINPSSFLP